MSVSRNTFIRSIRFEPPVNLPSEFSIFKHTNGLITVVNRDCSIVTYAEPDEGYEAISSILEHVNYSSGWDLMGWPLSHNTNHLGSGGN